MSVKIRIYGKEAIYARGCWSCDDDSLLAMLESIADPRAPHTEDAEREHALYAAGRFGGLILLDTGWVVADHPAPEITLEDLTGRPKKEAARNGAPPDSAAKERAGGWLTRLRRRS